MLRAFLSALLALQTAFAGQVTRVPPNAGAAPAGASVAPIALTPAAVSELGSLAPRVAAPPSADGADAKPALEPQVLQATSLSLELSASHVSAISATALPASALPVPIRDVPARPPFIDREEGSDSSHGPRPNRSARAQAERAVAAGVDPVRLGAVFSGSPAQAPSGAAEAVSAAVSLQDATKALFRVRRKSSRELQRVTREQFGTVVRDEALNRDLRRVLDRLLAAAGRPPEAATLTVGSSFLPNALTTITSSEARYLGQATSVAKGFRIANVFISMGALRAHKSEGRLALTLAHELMHNWKSHIKANSLRGSHEALGHLHEFEADAEALKLVAAAGYDPLDAADSLHDLYEESDRLEKDFSWFKGDKGELSETLQHLRDVHPNPDLRRAYLMDHMDEAMEAYGSARGRWPDPEPEPAWKARAHAELAPTALDRFAARLKELASQEELGKALRELEEAVQDQVAKRRDENRALLNEEVAAAEEAYRLLIGRVESHKAVRRLELSLERNQVKDSDGHNSWVLFPSPRLRSSLLTRQLDLVWRSLPKEATLEDFAKGAGALSVRGRRAGLLRALGAIRTRAQLDAAFRALAEQAEDLGLNLANLGEEVEREELVQAVTRRLWRGAARVLSFEGRSARPEALIDELRDNAHVSPAWLAAYELGFAVEIVDSAFGPPARRSESLRPSELLGRLRGVVRGKAPRRAWLAQRLPGLAYWSDRRHQPFTLWRKNGKTLHRHERHYLRGLAAPSQEDALDLARRFWFMGSSLPPSMILLLARDGRLVGFVRAAIRDVGEAAEAELKEAATAADRHKALERFSERIAALLRSALQDEREFASIRALAEAAWQETSAFAGRVQAGAAFSEEIRSQLGYGFLDALGDALRWAVILAARSGRRPPGAELAALGALAGKVEADLGMPSGATGLRAHARNLRRNLAGDRAYMRAFSSALPDAVEWRRMERLNDWIDEQETFDHHLRARLGRLWRWIVGRPMAWAYARDSRRSRREGFGPKDLWALGSGDFIYLLALAGDPAADAETKAMAAALADRLDLGLKMVDETGKPLGMAAAAAVGRWLLEDAAAQVPETGLPAFSRVLLRLHALHPGLHNPDIPQAGEMSLAFREGTTYVLRSEPMRTLVKQEHPFKGSSTRWALTLLGRLDRAAAWPERLEDRLDLLDLMNSTGEFSDAIDQRVIAQALSDPAAFRRWLARDRKRLKRLEGGLAKMASLQATRLLEKSAETVPMPEAHPLRIVRNPTLRSRLFDLLPGAERLGERARRSLWSRLKAAWRLFWAWRAARKDFSAAFLRALMGEGLLEDKIFDVMEEADRIAAQRAAEARARWDKGSFPREEKEFLEAELDGGEREWPGLPPHEKERLVAEFKERLATRALARLKALYEAYGGAQEPLLAELLKNYPEPTRARDALLERVLKSRRLSPGGIAFLEENKSYRALNPVRRAEKDLLDQAMVQLKKFTAAQRVDLILHLSGVRRLDPETIKALERKVLSGGRRRMARRKAGLTGLAQLESYMSLLHPKDRELLIRGQFSGEISLHKFPAEVERLYRGLVIEGRNLPPFLEKVLGAYFRVLSQEEKARLISDLGAQGAAAQGALGGPEVVRLALKSMKVTGAKIAQVLSTHRGLVPEEYARALEGFKDRAQEMEKSRAHALAEERLARLVPAAEPASAALDRGALAAIGREALPGLDEEKLAPLIDQVGYLLRAQGRAARRIEEMGPELGAGSIKVVCKVWLDDGRVWVVKLRAPGAAYRIGREFELLDLLIGELETGGDLDPVQTAQSRQILGEVRGLVRAELDMSLETAIERETHRRARERPWYARWLIGRAPFVPLPHPVFVGEDLIVEEFVPSTRFADLPDVALLGPSKRRVARLTVREGMFDLAFHDWLEPDAHTGNRNARRSGLLDRLRTTLLVFDLGQGQGSDIEMLKPFLKAGLALDAGDAAAAARILISAVQTPASRTPAELERAVSAALEGTAGEDSLARLMGGLLVAERWGAIILPRYAALQKAFMIFAGYAPWLPKDYLARSIERAMLARLWRDGRLSLWGALRLALRRLFLGRAAIRGELEALIDSLGSAPATPTEK